jgi:hypothetical protein
MQNFVRRENLKRFRKLLVKTTDETVRSQLFKLIAEEERRQILQGRDWSSLLKQEPADFDSHGVRQ